MFEWPRFAAHLNGPASAEEGVLALLAELATPGAASGARPVLAALFDDAALIAALETRAVRVDHAAMLAPPGLTSADVRRILAGSAFGDRLRQFTSAVLARDLAASFRRRVAVEVVRGQARGGAIGFPSVEVFVADLEAPHLRALLARETGCHVALALAPERTLDDVRDVLHAHGQHEIPLMRHGALSNPEIHASVLYVDVVRGGVVRRLEFIAAS